MNNDTTTNLRAREEAQSEQVTITKKVETENLEEGGYEAKLRKFARETDSYSCFLYRVEFDLRLSETNRDRFFRIMEEAQKLEENETVRWHQILLAIDGENDDEKRFKANYLFVKTRQKTGIPGTKFINLLLKYREYYEDEPVGETARARFKCFQKNRRFEEYLAILDKSKTLEERVEYIFTIMNFNGRMYNYFKSQLINFVVAAVKMKNIDIDTALSQLQTNNKMLVRMELARQINQFAKEIAIEHQENIATITFLKELQGFILSKEELQKLQ